MILTIYSLSLQIIGWGFFIERGNFGISRNWM